jgi:hypothetical protein
MNAEKTFTGLFQNGTTNRKRDRKEGGGKEWELTLCLRIYILLNMGHPMPELLS